ncbi:MAG: DUF4337 domain-containing protein [Chthonomonadaceae bacterium]|nr:DUF4337 domain-containing protein [Chthonomonadaceae bacterium]
MALDDPQETYDQIQEVREDERAERKREQKLKNVVALTIALLATFAGLCKVKAENVAQAMQKSESERVNQYMWYQARNVREEVLKTAAAEMEAGSANVSPTAKSAWDKQTNEFKRLAKEQGEKKEKQKSDGDTADKHYESLNVHDDQFDAADAFFSIAITLLALTALTGSWSLYFVALVPTSAGFLMGFAGLLNLNWKLDFLSKLLGA